MTARKKPVPPALHELEAEVMNQVWERQQATVRDVLEALNSGTKQRAYTTIMTIMSRLAVKGHLRRRRSGKTNIYSPAMSREDYLQARARAEVDELVTDYGDVALAHFARRLGGLDAKRREQLRRLAEGGP